MYTHAPIYARQPMLTVNSVTEESRLSIKFIQKWNTVIVRGNSTRLDVAYAYQKLIDKCKKHLANAEEMQFYFFYTVVNATTAKLLFNLFKTLEKAANKHKKVKVHWLVEEGDRDLLDLGLDYKSLLKFDFHIAKK